MHLFKLNLCKLVLNVTTRTCSNATHTVETLQRILDIPHSSAQNIVFKRPSICKYDATHLQQVTKVIEKLGMLKSDLAKNPVNFTYLPVTLKLRYQVLQECGFEEINLSILSKYLYLVKKPTISSLKGLGYISHDTNVGRNLVNQFTKGSTAKSVLPVRIDEDDCNILTVRMKILQRYLEFIVDLLEEEFVKKLKIYNRVYHRPFGVISEVLNILQTNFLLSTDKIKSNFFLLHSDPDNLKRILFEIREIGGISVKDIIRKYPKFCMPSVDNMLKMREVFKEYGIKDEHQVRCLRIFTLSAETVKDRLQSLKSIPEFEAFKQHPRVLLIIYHKKEAMQRLDELLKSNKKCFSLNILSGSKVQYNVFKSGQGDRTKGSDLVKAICTLTNKDYKESTIRRDLKRHPYWINTPITSVMSVHKSLIQEYSTFDICKNCILLLYPLSKIEKILSHIKQELSHIKPRTYMFDMVILDNVDSSKLTKSQILSLALYFLEREHYFSGNGIWSDEALMKRASRVKEQADPARSIGW